MQKDKTVLLQVRPKPLKDGFGFFVNQARGKTVLNIGAAGGVENYLPDKKEMWLNFCVGEVASDLVGVDIDRESIDYAARHGFTIREANCEDMNLERKFDLIILSDVIEHLNAPGKALLVLMEHLAPNGKLVLSTPNPTHYGNLFRILFGKEIQVYYDHVTCFYPEHLQAFCDRFGFRLSELYYFGYADQRSLGRFVKSKVGSLIGRVFPRMSSTIMAVIQKPV